VNSLAFSPDGGLLASGSSDDDGLVRIWDRIYGRCVTLEGQHTGAIRSVQFSPDGNILATASDHRIRLWKLADHTHQVLEVYHHGEITAIAFSPDGAYLASGGGLYSFVGRGGW
jgi:WD40 repeat protein